VNYEYTPPHSTNAKKSIVGTGTRYVLRYVGESPSLAETLTHIKLHRVGNRVAHWVNCPFCSTPMVQSSLSGKRREAQEERYKCRYDHRVSLMPDGDGHLGWK